ncbi:MAG: putative Acetyltransferase, contains domain [Verrucomicrobiaceae bacterium]|nr:putative Acetyltransferase, contains domain [Verrucomicrobiaceae bacterium]
MNIDIQHSCKASECDDIFSLYRSASGTLGFLPRGAFDEGIEKGNIITARNEAGELIGYLLYRQIQHRAAITHLCVAAKAREKGVAGKLVERLKHRTADLDAITLWCRRDFPAAKCWPKWGFIAKTEKAGRGSDGGVLVLWSLDNNPYDLLSCISTNKTLVAIDTNIFFDLILPDRPKPSLALLEPWIDETIDLALTPEVFNDINRSVNSAFREKNRVLARAYYEIRVSASQVNKYVLRVRSLFQSSSGSSEQTESDIRHLGYSVASGIEYFVTRDEEILARSGQLLDEFNLHVLSPVELVGRLDWIEREREYQPRRLQSSSVSEGRLEAVDISSAVDSFWLQGQERKTILRPLLEQCIADPRRCTVKVSRAFAGQMLALLATRVTEGMEITIPLVRLANEKLAPTVLRHMLMGVVVEASKLGATGIMVTDEMLSGSVCSALQELGFVKIQRGWLKPGLSGFLKEDSLRKTLQGLGIVAEETGRHTRDFTETLIWPAKLYDDSTPCYLIPIQEQWADHFFEVDSTAPRFAGIPSLREDLHLGIEAVYYSATRMKLIAPGRIIWYVSRGKSGLGSMEVKATSRLREVVRGGPKELFKRFERLGVYEWKQVFDAAKKDLKANLVALRFSHTECFANPLDLNELRNFGVKTAPQGPLQLPFSVFKSIFDLAYSPNS